MKDYARADWKWLQYPAIPLAVLLVLMLPGVLDDSNDPGTGAEFGIDGPWAIPLTLVLGVTELVVWTAIIRPRSNDHSWARYVVSGLGFLMWGFFNGILCMHCGPIASSRSLWLTLLGFVTFVFGLTELAPKDLDDPDKHR